jgi:cytochrome c-type biogenesis protein CcmH/NrfG
MTVKNKVKSGGDVPGTKTFSMSSKQKVLVGVLGLALLVMFVSSFYYRMSHPGNRVEFRQQESSGMGGGMSASTGESMKNIRKLMDKLDKNPQDKEVILNLADSFMMIRSYDRARKFFERALAIDSKNIHALMGLGMCYYQSEDFDKAINSFGKLLEIDPNDPMAHYNIGIIQKYYTHDHEKAKAHFNAVISSPDSEEDLKAQAREELKSDDKQ